MKMISVWKKRIDDATELYFDAFSGLSSGELNWKPSEKEWSIGQIIDHVMTANATYFPLFHAMKEGKYKPHWASRIPGWPGFLGKMVLQGSSPGQKRKYKTGAVFEPRRSNIDSGILEIFRQNQEEVKSAFDLVSGLDLKKTIVSSPMNSAVVYPLYAAGEIITAHELRHLEQAQRVLDRMKISVQEVATKTWPDRVQYKNIQS